MPFNNPDFTPTHPIPVLYVHGFTLATRSFRINALHLRDYGTTERTSLIAASRALNGFGKINDMVEELAENVEKVKRPPAPRRSTSWPTPRAVC